MFQLDGVSNPDCKDVFFELKEDYPLSFDPGFNSRITTEGGTYAKDFSSYLIIPYEARIDRDALDGDTPIEVQFGTVSGSVSFSEEFNLNIKEVRVDFEIFVKDYNPATNLLTLEILNIGKNDIEALTVEIPEQENIRVKGAPRNVVGSLDSNDFTTAEFEAVPSEGNINLRIYYTDETNARRSLNKTVQFNPKYFEGNGDESRGTFIYAVVIMIIAAVAYYFYRRHKKHKRKHLTK